MIQIPYFCQFRIHLRSVPSIARLPLCIILFAAGITTGFAQRPLGIDVSDYQGTGINWTNVKSSGITFAWAKATEGLTLNDASFTVNEGNARAAGVLVGAYHYAHPDTHVGLSGADEEAQHFWSVASNYINGSGTYLMPMLDFEQSVTNVSPAYTQATLSAWANEWCQDIVAYAASNGVTVKPVVYTFVSYADGDPDYGPGLNSSITNWPLWMAEYPDNPNPQTGAPSSTSPWTGWSFWQYSSTGTVSGISGTEDVDLDVFDGAASSLGAFVVGGLATPYIISQTVNSRVIDSGSNATFTATAGGTAPLSYQWNLNSVSVPGATNLTINIASAQASNSGTYTLIVSNNAGAVTGSPLTLIVFPPQVTVFSDNFDSNTATNWMVNRSSTDTFVAFNYNYAALGVPSAPNSTNGTTLGVQLKANLTQGVVSALSISPIGQSFAGDYRLHFDAWINVNGPFPGGGASSTEYLSAGIGTAGNRAEWTGSGSTADGYYFTADGDGGVSATSTTFGDYSGYHGTTWENAASGIYAAGSLDNANVYYETIFPVGQAAPALQKADYSQQTGNLSTGTFGLAWHDVIVSRRGSTVNWAVDGVLFATFTNATFTASNVFVGFWDPFASLTDNTNLSFGLVDNLRVEVPATLPIFTLNPLSQTVPLGTNVTFTAAATGLPSPVYQWDFNGTNISGANSSNHPIASVSQGNVGTYSVIVSNSAGSVTSSNAVLALVPPSAAQFTTAALQSDNTLQLNFTGNPYWTYTIQTSTDLVNWSIVTNLATTNGIFSYDAGSVTNSPQQFFRILVSY